MPFFVTVAPIAVHSVAPRRLHPATLPGPRVDSGVGLADRSGSLKPPASVHAGDWRLAVPKGTEETAELLDELGVPEEASVRSARKALREVDEGRRAEVFSAAMTYRKQSGKHPAFHLPETPVETPRNNPTNRRAETRRETSGNTCCPSGTPDIAVYALEVGRWWQAALVTEPTRVDQ